MSWAMRRCWLRSSPAGAACGPHAPSRIVHRNGISHDEVALAVVVQAMVQSEAAGVLFTANPLTGKRGEAIIDATLGLGEALVGGQVEPDNYVVARRSDHPQDARAPKPSPSEDRPAAAQ